MKLTLKDKKHGRYEMLQMYWVKNPDWILVRNVSVCIGTSSGICKLLWERITRTWGWHGFSCTIYTAINTNYSRKRKHDAVGNNPQWWRHDKRRSDGNNVKPSSWWCRLWRTKGKRRQVKTSFFIKSNIAQRLINFSNMQTLNGLVV